MLMLNDKISYLENYLNKIEDNYAESFKADIAIYIDDFHLNNSRLYFLNNLNSNKEIENWVQILISRIVMKFDIECESLNDFIFDYCENG